MATSNKCGCTASETQTYTEKNTGCCTIDSEAPKLEPCVYLVFVHTVLAERLTCMAGHFLLSFISDILILLCSSHLLYLPVWSLYRSGMLLRSVFAGSNENYVVLVSKVNPGDITVSGIDGLLVVQLFSFKIFHYLCTA